MLPLGTSAPVTIYGSDVLGLTNNASLTGNFTIYNEVGSPILKAYDQVAGAPTGIAKTYRYSYGLAGTAKLANATGAKAIVCIKH